MISFQKSSLGWSCVALQCEYNTHTHTHTFALMSLTQRIMPSLSRRFSSARQQHSQFPENGATTSPKRSKRSNQMNSSPSSWLSWQFELQHSGRLTSPKGSLPKRINMPDLLSLGILTPNGKSRLLRPVIFCDGLLTNTHCHVKVTNCNLC